MLALTRSRVAPLPTFTVPPVPLVTVVDVSFSVLLSIACSVALLVTASLCDVEFAAIGLQRAGIDESHEHRRIDGQRAAGRFDQTRIGDADIA